ncbi:MAG TPA: SDR family oxidoreductase [Ohtaekwangia sp.]|nr:SDR family oxidoreductase [Ohtaekwangia sp.]
MEQNQNQYALITGATSGIGYELAKLFAQNGYNLVIVARSDGDLQTASREFLKHGVNVVPIAKDLFNPEAAAELYEEVKAKGIEVNVLVNDAGQGQYGLFVESDIDRQLEIIQLNVSSLTALTYFFLKDMVARNEGKILQLASIASNMPGPLQAVYHATKAYVLSLTEALINELKDTAVTMTALQPGVTDTDFFNKAGAQNSKLVEDEDKMSDPAKVAKDGYDALMRGESKIISGAKNKIMVGMSHLVPDSMNAQQIRKMSEEQDEEDRKD